MAYVAGILEIILYILILALLIPFFLYIAARAWWDGYFTSRKDYHKTKFKGGSYNDDHKG